MSDTSAHGPEGFILSGLKQHYGKCDMLIGPAYKPKLITGIQKSLCVCVLCVCVCVCVCVCGVWVCVCERKTESPNGLSLN